MSRVEVKMTTEEAVISSPFIVLIIDDIFEQIGICKAKWPAVVDGTSSPIVLHVQS